MNDFFDQDTGEEEDEGNVPMTDRPEGASILVNGSYRPLEVGAPFLQAIKPVAIEAGFGKFRVFLNGTEVRPSTAPAEVSADMNLEIRPFDEAG